jgi:hypothetical protein
MLRPRRRNWYVASRLMVVATIPSKRWVSAMTRSRKRPRLQRSTPSLWWLVTYRYRLLTASHASRDSISRALRRLLRAVTTDDSTLDGLSSSASR